MLQMQTKGHFKRDCMAENVHMYQKEEAEENVNMRQKAKPITPKAILKRSNLKTIEEDQKAEVNLRRGSNPYQYNVVDDFRWTPTNMFFEDLMEVGSYRESIQQYLAAVKRKKQRNVKAAQVEEKPVYRSYVKLGRNSIQASWDTKAQISVCTKLLATKLGLKWIKPTEVTNMITVDGQKRLTLGIVENAQLKIIDALVPINIHIIDSTKEELLIESNWFSKYKADLILTENKLKFVTQERKFEVKIINTTSSNAKVQWYKEDEDIEVITVASDSDNESTLTL